MPYVRCTASALGVLLACLTAAAPAPAAAQVGVLNGTAFGDIELGARFFLTKPADTEFAWLERYRDLRAGAIVPAARGWFDTDGGRTRVELRTRWPGQDDENLRLAVQRLGAFRVELERDRTPHVFTTNGRLLGSSTERGVLTLPVPRPAADAFNAAPVLGTVGTRWTHDRVALTLMPALGISTLFEYGRTAKRGDRPMGMAFGTAGSNHREILEPIEQTVQHVRVAPAVRRERWQLQASYDYSSFDNDIAAVIADNPLVAADQATAGSSRGRSALAPSNRAHQMAVQGGAVLPLRGRVTGTVAYGVRRQTAPLLPYTINSAINTSGLTRLPEHADGDVRTLLVRLAGSARPLPDVTVGAHFRRFELTDHTPAIELAGRVVADRSLSTAAITTHRYPHTKQNAGADVRWRIARPLLLRVGYGREQWERDTHVREVARTTEHTPRVTLDVMPAPWLRLHTGYLRAARRGDGYAETVAVQLPLLRKLDVADRDRERAEVVAEVIPIGALSLAGSWAHGSNDYPDSRYGRTADRNRATGAYATWTPAARVAVHASLVRESFRVQQRSRYRIPPALLENESWDWIGDTDDVVITAGLGLNATLIPRRLEVGLNWDRIETTSQMTTHNPTTPTGGTDAQRASAVATDFPEIRYDFTPASAWLHYRLSDRWSARVGYTEERFRYTDFRSDGLRPVTGADIFMGNDLEGYNARMVSVRIRYAPRIPGVPVL
jgi:MtrB/PioB family decaheme-associated outer membrane protein